jgi:hypothetical protein
MALKEKAVSLFHFSDRSRLGWSARTAATSPSPNKVHELRRKLK